MRLIKKEIIKQEQKQNNMDVCQQLMNPANKVSNEIYENFRVIKVPNLMIENKTIEQGVKIYIDEYMKLFEENRQLNSDLIEIFEDRNRLAQKYNELKREQNDCDDIIRRKRRFANEIKRNFECPQKNCHKSYGSEGSLTQHVKLKHENFYRSGQYEIVLQEMLDEMLKNGVKREQNMVLMKKQEIGDEDRNKNDFKIEQKEKDRIKKGIKKQVKMEIQIENEQEGKIMERVRGGKRGQKKGRK